MRPGSTRVDGGHDSSERCLGGDALRYSDDDAARGGADADREILAQRAFEIEREDSGSTLEFQPAGVQVSEAAQRTPGGTGVEAQGVEFDQVRLAEGQRESVAP